MEVKKIINCLLAASLSLSCLSLVTEDIHAEENSTVSKDYVKTMDNESLHVINDQLIEGVNLPYHQGGDDITNPDKILDTFINNVFVADMSVFGSGNTEFALLDFQGNRLVDFPITHVSIIHSYYKFNDQTSSFDESYNNRFIRVGNGEGYHIFDTVEKKLWTETVFDEVQDFYSGISIVSKGNEKGAFNKDGNWIVEPTNPCATQYDDYTLFVTNITNPEGIVGFKFYNDTTQYTKYKYYDYNGRVIYEIEDEWPKIGYRGFYDDYLVTEPYYSSTDSVQVFEVFNNRGGKAFSISAANPEQYIEMSNFNQGFALLAVNNYAEDGNRINGIIYLVNKDGEKIPVIEATGVGLNSDNVETLNSSEFLFKASYLRLVDEGFGVSQISDTILIRADGSYIIVPEEFGHSPDISFHGDYMSIDGNIYDNQLNLAFEDTHLSYYNHTYDASLSDKDNSNYAYLRNDAGEIVLNRQTGAYSEIYDLIYAKYNGYFRVEKDGLYGFIDENGKEVIPPIYEESVYTPPVIGEPKVELMMGKYDRVIVKTENGNCGIVDTEGNVYPNEYAYIAPFEDQLTYAKTLDGQDVYINTKGEIILDEQRCPFFYEKPEDKDYQQFQTFTEGYGAVLNGWGELIYFDYNGNIVAELDDVSELNEYTKFHNGRAILPVHYSLEEERKIFIQNLKYGEEPEEPIIPEKTEFTEREIYETYPESLTNNTDELYENAFEFALALHGDRKVVDDFLSSLRTAGSDISASMDYIVKFLATFGTNTDLIYKEYVDQVVLELVRSLSEDDSSLESAVESAYSNVTAYKTVNKAFKAAEKLGPDKLEDEFVKYYKKNYGKFDKDIEKRLRDTFKKGVKTFTKVFDKGTEAAFTFTDVFFVCLQTEEIKLNLVDFLLEEFIHGDIHDGLIRLKKKMKSNLLWNTLSGTTNELIMNEISSSLKKGIEKYGVENIYKFLGLNFTEVDSLSEIIGKLIVKSISEMISEAGADDVIKTKITEGMALYLYGSLHDKRKIFVDAYEMQKPLDDMDKEIGIYKSTYNALNKSMLQYLKSVKPLGNSNEQECIQEFIDELEKYNYTAYLNQCVKKIRKNTFQFAGRYDPTGGYIIEQVKRKAEPSLASEDDVYDGSFDESILIIPDEIDGKKVIGIDAGAIAGNYTGIIFNDSLQMIDENAIKIDNELSYIRLNSLIPDLKLPISKVSVAPLAYEDNNVSDQYIPLVNEIESIEVVSNPKSLKYDPNKEYDSTGLKISVTSRGEKVELDTGWLENISFVEGKPVLNIIIGNARTSIPLELTSDAIKCLVHFVDKDLKEIKDSKEINVDVGRQIDYEEEIKGYTFVGPKSEVVATKDTNELYLIYDKNVKFDISAYILTNKEPVEVAYSSLFESDFVLESQDSNIFNVDENGKIYAVSNGSGYLTVKDSKGNSDEALVVVELEKEEPEPEPDPDKVEFKKKEYTLNIGDTLDLKKELIVSNQVLLDEVNFSVSDEKIAKIEKDFTLVGEKTGEVTVSVFLNDTLMSTCKVTIKHKDGSNGDDSESGNNPSKPEVDTDKEETDTSDKTETSAKTNQSLMIFTMTSSMILGVLLIVIKKRETM